MINKNWDRWLLASASVYVISCKENYKLYIEGQDRTIGPEDDFAELRYSGPNYQQLSRKEYRLRIELNILVNVIKDATDNHKIHRMCGVFEDSLAPMIPAYKFGDGTDDDRDFLLGCLQRIKIGNDDVVTTHFGQINPELRILQSTIEAHYYIDLKG